MAPLIGERDFPAVLIHQPGEWRRRLARERSADDVRGRGDLHLGRGRRRMRTHRQRHGNPDRHAADERQNDEERLSALRSSATLRGSPRISSATSLSASGISRERLPTSIAGLHGADYGSRCPALCARDAPAYARDVIPQRQIRVAASGGVLLALLGLFIGHTLEYLRVWGAAGVVASMTNPVHAYMLPVGGVLVVLSAVFALRLRRAWRALNHRLDNAVASLHRIWRGGSEAAAEQRPRSSPGARLVAIWLPLAAAQIVLYLVQENVEAVASSVPRPVSVPSRGSIGRRHSSISTWRCSSPVSSASVRCCSVAARWLSSASRHSCARWSGVATPSRRATERARAASRHSNVSACISGGDHHRCSSTSDRRP